MKSHIWQIIDFLNEAQDEGYEPIDRDQPSFNPNLQDRGEVDWDRLTAGDVPLWDFEPTNEDLNDLERAFNEEPTLSNNGRLNGSPERAIIWDICAWYQPIHFYAYDWGIYIKEDCVFRSAKSFARFVPNHERGTYTMKEWFNRFSLAALFVYYLHEHYHHRVESLGLRLHVVKGRSCYRPYDRDMYRVLRKNASLPPAAWANGWDPDEQIEEALANANSFHRIGEKTYRSRLSTVVVNAVRDCLVAQFPIDPPGYRRASDYLTPESFRQGGNLLQDRVNKSTLVPGPAFQWNLAPGMTRSFYGNKSKFWGVVDRHGKFRFPIV